MNLCVKVIVTAISDEATKHRYSVIVGHPELGGHESVIRFNAQNTGNLKIKAVWVGC